MIGMIGKIGEEGGILKEEMGRCLEEVILRSTISTISNFREASYLISSITSIFSPGFPSTSTIDPSHKISEWDAL